MLESLILRDKQTLKSVLIDTVSSPFVLGDTDLGTIEGSHNSYRFYDQIGAYIESTILQQREISIKGWVVGDTYEELRANKKVLNSLINPKSVIELIVYEEYKLEFKPDSTIQYSVTYKENNDVFCKFLIQGTCPDPMFTSVNSIGIDVAATLPKFKFPLIIPQSSGVVFGVKEYSPIAYVTNPGDVEAGMVITFGCSSSVENPQILNIANREFLRINKTITPGEQVIISTIDGDKYVRGYSGGEQQNYFSYRDWESSWLKLAVGENILQYSADSNPEGLEVQIVFQPRYLEVQ